MTDDDAGNSPFGITNMVPGQTISRCVMVTYEGTIDAVTNVRMYAAYEDATAAATEGAAYLDLTVKVAPAGQSCSDGFAAPSVVWPASGTSTMASFVTAYPSYGQGLDTGWRPSSSIDRNRAVQLTVTLPVGAPDAAQGTSAKPVFWSEIRTS